MHGLRNLFIRLTKYINNNSTLFDNYFRQADQGHTEVKLLLKFNGDKDGSTEKLRKIVKTGDIAGISVDANFFKMEGKL